MFFLYFDGHMINENNGKLLIEGILSVICCMFLGFLSWEIFQCLMFFKRSIVGSETIFDNWKLLKNDEKSYSFHVKSLFRSWDICIFVCFFVYIEERLDKRV